MITIAIEGPGEAVVWTFSGTPLELAEELLAGRIPRHGWPPGPYWLTTETFLGEVVEGTVECPDIVLLREPDAVVGQVAGTTLRAPIGHHFTPVALEVDGERVAVWLTDLWEEDDAWQDAELPLFWAGDVPTAGHERGHSWPDPHAATRHCLAYAGGKLTWWKDGASVATRRLLPARLPDRFASIDELRKKLPRHGLAGRLEEAERIELHDVHLDLVARAPLGLDLLVVNAYGPADRWAKVLEGREPTEVVVRFVHAGPDEDVLRTLGARPGSRLELHHGVNGADWTQIRAYPWASLDCVVAPGQLTSLLSRPLATPCRTTLREGSLHNWEHVQSPGALQTTAGALASVLAVASQPLRLERLQLSGDLGMLLPLADRFHTAVLEVAPTRDPGLLTEQLLSLSAAFEELDATELRLDASQIARLEDAGVVLVGAHPWEDPQKDPAPAGLPLHVDRTETLQAWLVAAREPIRAALAAAGVDPAVIAPLSALGAGDYDPRTNDGTGAVTEILKNLPRSRLLRVRLDTLRMALLQFGIDARYHDPRWRAGVDERAWAALRSEAVLHSAHTGQAVSSAILHLAPAAERPALRAQLEHARASTPHGSRR